MIKNDNCFSSFQYYLYLCIMLIEIRLIESQVINGCVSNINNREDGSTKNGTIHDEVFLAVI